MSGHAGIEEITFLEKAGDRARNFTGPARKPQIKGVLPRWWPNLYRNRDKSKHLLTTALELVERFREQRPLWADISHRGFRPAKALQRVREMKTPVIKSGYSIQEILLSTGFPFLRCQGLVAKVVVDRWDKLAQGSVYHCDGKSVPGKKACVRFPEYVGNFISNCELFCDLQPQKVKITWPIFSQDPRRIRERLRVLDLRYKVAIFPAGTRLVLQSCDFRAVGTLYFAHQTFTTKLRFSSWSRPVSKPKDPWKCFFLPKTVLSINNSIFSTATWLLFAVFGARPDLSSKSCLSCFTLLIFFTDVSSSRRSCKARGAEDGLNQ